MSRTGRRFAVAVAVLMTAGGLVSCSAPEPTDAAPVPLAVTEAPPPPPGPVGEPTVATTTLPPVAVGAPAELGPGLRVEVGEISVVDRIEATRPGEVSGPGVVVRISVDNSTSEPFDLGGLGVEVATGPDLAPASPSETEPSAPLAGRLEPGDDAEGTYVFLVSGAAPTRVQVAVQSAAHPAVMVVER